MLKQQGVEMITVGVGSLVNSAELEQVASESEQDITESNLVK